MSSNYDHEHSPNEPVSSDMRADPVPALMLTLPTPEIPTSLRFAPQSPFTISEFSTANSSIPTFPVSTHDISRSSNRISDDLQGLKQAGFQEPFVRHGKSDMDNGIATELLNVPSWSTRGLGMGVRVCSGDVVADNEKVESKRSLMYPIAENDACPSGKDEDADVPLDKTEFKTKTRKRISLWTIRKLIEVSLRRHLSRSAADTDVSQPYLETSCDNSGPTKCLL